MDAAPAPPPASGGVGGEPVDEAKAQSREDSLRHVATEVGAYAVAQPLQTTDAPPQAASDGAPLQRSLSGTASGSVAVASKLCVAPSLAQATPDSSRARGRVPHPDSLREKRTQRGGREFTYVPPDHMREGGDANKPVEVRVRTTILSLRNINLVEQTFTCQFFLEASWLDVGMVEVSKDGVIKLREVNAAESTQARGKLVAVNDNEHFFFTPQLRFANRVNTDMRLEEFYEVSHSTQELRQPVNGKTRGAVVCWRVLGTGVFQSPVDLRHFPFDSQTLAIKLISDWDVSDVRLVRNMKAAYRSLVQDGAFLLEQEYELSRMLHMMPIDSNPLDSSSGVTRSTLHIEMRVRRKPTYWFWNVSAPLFFFTGISFAAFAVEVTALSDRLSITITMLLTLVAYRFAIMDRLPNVDDLTLLDIYVQLCFMVVYAVTIHCVGLAVRAESSLSELMEPGATWAMPTEWQGSQRTALWACSTAWICLNVCIYPGVWLSRVLASWRLENLQWWDTSNTMLWIGGEPIAAWKERVHVSEDEMRTALQNAINMVVAKADVVVPARRDEPDELLPVKLRSITVSDEREQQALRQAYSTDSNGRPIGRTASTGGGASLRNLVRALSGRVGTSRARSPYPLPSHASASSPRSGSKLLPESKGKWAVLQFGTEMQAWHALLAIDEAVSLECETCRNARRKTKVHLVLAAPSTSAVGANDPDALKAAADACAGDEAEWQQLLANLAACVGLAAAPCVCSKCFKPTAVGTELGEDDKKTLKAAIAEAEIVCEVALPEYKSLLKRRSLGGTLRKWFRRHLGTSAQGK